VSVAEERVEGSEAGSDDDSAPDSAVRAIPAARDAIVTPMPPGTRALEIAIRVSAALMASSKTAYVTLSIPGGEVLYEGFTSEGGSLDIAIEIAATATSVHALVEAGTKYRHATFAISADGVTELTFA
jgi:hypothetical protein